MSSKRFKAVVMMLAVLALGSILLAACVRPGTTTTTSTGGGSTATSTPSGGGGGGGSGNCANGTVQTGVSTFMQSCVTVAKGASLKIVPAVTSLHILTNGSWVNGNAQLAKESGAPSIDNVNESNAPVEIGPFTTAGTFHILCTVHPNMNLTVEVK
jgi:plastocyanin